MKIVLQGSDRQGWSTDEPACMEDVRAHIRHLASPAGRAGGRMFVYLNGILKIRMDARKIAAMMTEASE